MMQEQYIAVFQVLFKQGLKQYELWNQMVFMLFVEFELNLECEFPINSTLFMLSQFSLKNFVHAQSNLSPDYRIIFIFCNLLCIM
jgi:hypothetical protein